MAHLSRSGPVRLEVHNPFKHSINAQKLMGRTVKENLIFTENRSTCERLHMSRLQVALAHIINLQTDCFKLAQEMHFIIQVG
jgi:hypothetical protein